MTLRACSVLLALGALASCGGGGPTFTPVSLSIDKSGLLSNLASAGQTVMCGQLSAALSASFGTKEATCMLNSRTLYLTYPQCKIEYDACIGGGTGPRAVDACTSKMSAMWSCPITVGQYEACFNAMNSALFNQVMAGPSCTPLPTDKPPIQNDACKAAPCVYDWYD